MSDLERMLRASLPACTEVPAGGDTPTLDHLAVELGALPPGGPALDPRIKIPGGGCSVGELAQLRLTFRVRWPLSMLLDDGVLQQYNAVAVFLLQVQSTPLLSQYTCLPQLQWAEHALDELRRARWRASKEQASSPIDSLTMEMTHFVVTLHAFVSERMLHVAWTQLLQVVYLCACASLQRMHRRCPTRRRLKRLSQRIGPICFRCSRRVSCCLTARGGCWTRRCSRCSTSCWPTASCNGRKWTRCRYVAISSSAFSTATTAYASAHDAAGGGAAADDWAGV